MLDELQILCLAERLAAFAPQKIVDAIAGYPAEPGPQFGGLAQTIEVLPGSNERFLRHILALPEPADGAVRQRTDQSLIARYDLPEGISIPTQSLGNQICVCECGGRIHVSCHHN